MGSTVAQKPSDAETPSMPMEQLPVFFGSGISINGAITSIHDLYFDGQIEGLVEASGRLVTVGLNARLSCGINARRVIILGTVLGPIKAVESVELKKSGKLLGDVTTARIVIEDGADFKGSIDISSGATNHVVPPEGSRALDPSISLPLLERHAHAGEASSAGPV